jgi:DHA2 family multidrug resistance protein
MNQAASAAANAPTSAPAEAIPWLGITAVLLGTFISTLTTRLSNSGIADVRGAVHAGFDDGAWITTAQTAAQMLITPFSVWAGSVYGPRQVLLIACSVFAVASLLLPWSPNLPTLLGLQFVAGLGSGCFIPLTLSYILLRMPQRLWTYGIALYALNIELSLNISASLEGWYVEHASWRWIFWQNVPLAVAMAACLLVGVRMGPRVEVHKVDVFGLTTSGAGLALIYAALDQGNRLDWQNSGLIWGLMLAGGVILVAFFIHARTVTHSWIDIRAAFRFPLPLLMLLISLLRLSILTTAFLIPQYLTVVRGFRALQVGDTLIWLAIPQLLLSPLAGFVLRFVDPRLGAGLGMVCIGCAGLLVAYGLTPLWGSDQFLPSQLIQAMGQSLALTGVVYASVLNLPMGSALTFGAMIQTARLFGGEVGTAFVSTFQRIREQRASNLIGLHVQVGSHQVVERMQVYGHVAARAGHYDGQSATATVLLGRTVHSAATVQSVIDGFMTLPAVAVIALICLALLTIPPRRPTRETSPDSRLSGGS